MSRENCNEFMNSLCMGKVHFTLWTLCVASTLFTSNFLQKFKLTRHHQFAGNFKQWLNLRYYG